MPLPRRPLPPYRILLTLPEDLVSAVQGEVRFSWEYPDVLDGRPEHDSYSVAIPAEVVKILAPLALAAIGERTAQGKDRAGAEVAHEVVDAQAKPWSAKVEAAEATAADVTAALAAIEKP